jgi:2-keto-myo-inositol isomerase
MDKIAFAAAAGFSAVELWNDDLIAFEAQGGSLREVNRRLTDANLKVPSVIALSGWMQNGDRQKWPALPELRRRMEQAAFLGAPHIVASPIPDSATVDIGQAAASYHELLELGEEIGVSPSMGFLGFFRNVYQLEQAVAIARQANHPAASIVLDPFHLYRGGSGFGGIKNLGDTRISICHFNDSPAAPPQFEQLDADRVYPGDGILPLDRFLLDLASLGYNGCLSVELFNPTYWHFDLREVAQTAYEKAASIVARVVDLLPLPSA